MSYCWLLPALLRKSISYSIRRAPSECQGPHLRSHCGHPSHVVFQECHGERKRWFRQAGSQSRALKYRVGPDETKWRIQSQKVRKRVGSCIVEIENALQTSGLVRLRGKTRDNLIELFGVWRIFCIIDADDVAGAERQRIIHGARLCGDVTRWYNQSAHPVWKDRIIQMCSRGMIVGLDHKHHVQQSFRIIEKPDAL